MLCLVGVALLATGCGAVDIVKAGPPSTTTASTALASPAPTASTTTEASTTSTTVAPLAPAAGWEVCGDPAGLARGFAVAWSTNTLSAFPAACTRASDPSPSSQARDWTPEPLTGPMACTGIGTGAPRAEEWDCRQAVGNGTVVVGVERPSSDAPIAIERFVYQPGAAVCPDPAQEAGVLVAAWRQSSLGNVRPICVSKSVLDRLAFVPPQPLTLVGGACSQDASPTAGARCVFSGQSLTLTFCSQPLGTAAASINDLQVSNAQPVPPTTSTTATSTPPSTTSTTLDPVRAQAVERRDSRYGRSG